MKGAIASALACVCFAGLACAKEPSAELAGNAPITASELAARIEGNAAPFVLDVRTPEEFARGHVPGAVNVSHTELEQNLSVLPEALDAELVVLCERGGRASAAEQLLRDRGYTRVRDLEGHMQGWRAEQRPME